MAQRGRRGRNKEFYFSLLRAVACVFFLYYNILFIHNGLFQEYEGEGLFSPLSFSRCLMWPIPCVIMTSGALLLNPEADISLGKIFRRYIPSALSALLVSGLCYQLFTLLMEGGPFTVRNAMEGLFLVLSGKGWPHLSYFYIMIGLYLMLPFYRMVAKDASAGQLKYFLTLQFIFLSILPLAASFGFLSGFYIHVSSIFPFYFFLGYVLHEGTYGVNKPNSLLLFLSGTGIILLSSYFQDRIGIDPDHIASIFDCHSFPVIMQSIGMFCFFRRDIRQSGIYLDFIPREAEPGILKKIIISIDECALGIFLIHAVFLRILLQYLNVNLAKGGPVAILLVGFVIFLLSWGISFLFRSMFLND